VIGPIGHATMYCTAGLGDFTVLAKPSSESDKGLKDLISEMGKILG
jgi:hypothetical protein